MTFVQEMYCPKCGQTMHVSFFHTKPTKPVNLSAAWCPKCQCPTIPCPVAK